MLKKNAKFFESLIFILDLFVISLAWILSYYIRFYSDPFKPPLLGIPPFLTYIECLLPLGVLWALLSKISNMYRPRRMEHSFKEFLDIGKVLSLTLIVSIAIFYLFRKFEFSRLAFVYFWLVCFLGLISMRIIIRKTLKVLRKRRYNQRWAIIAGTGRLGQELLEKIELHPELGIQVIGFLAKRGEEVGRTVRNIPVVGTYNDLDDIFKGNRFDIFFVALQNNESDDVEKLLANLRGRLVDIKVVPGVYEFFVLRGGIDELDNLPIVNIQESPLYGWSRVSKRIIDLLLGMLAFVISSPFILVIGLLIKMSSKGPILYRQERIGMNGRRFKILKFRTMRVDAEAETGPIWAQESDPRKTKIGVFLRKSSLDELPQLFNVIKGEMSLVGPRPERPFFIKKFRDSDPSYMLRHKIKAGMTGWAQINGFRGNTSIPKRIEYDLYYIQNWSIAFDLKILMMTLWKGVFNKSAY